MVGMIGKRELDVDVVRGGFKPWREAEREFRARRDREQRVTLPEVTCQRDCAEGQ